MATRVVSQARARKPASSPFKRWLLAGYIKEIEGPFEREKEHHRHHSWWKVMCLTGLCLKSQTSRLDRVSTTCGSGWVRRRRARFADVL